MELEGGRVLGPSDATPPVNQGLDAVMSRAPITIPRALIHMLEKQSQYLSHTVSATSTMLVFKRGYFLLHARNLDE